MGFRKTRDCNGCGVNKKYIIIFILLIICSIIYFSIKNIKYENFLEVSYLQDVEESGIKRLKKTKIKNNNYCTIGFITDIHMNETEEEAYLNNIKLFTDLSKTGLIDINISGGDLYYGTWQNKDEGKVNLKYAKLLFSNVQTPMLYVRGNHDCNIKKKPEEAISNEDYYNIMLKQLENEIVLDSNNPMGGYYYKDIEKSKVRICVLNAFNGENYQYIFGEEQLEFVAEQVLNFESKKDANEWQVIFFSHTIEDSFRHTDTVEGKEKLYDILDAYKNGTNIKIGEKTISYEKQGKGTVIAIITGHHHIDSIKYVRDIPIITTRSASAIYERN
mgnify:FL=1